MHAVTSRVSLITYTYILLQLYCILVQPNTIINNFLCGSYNYVHAH